MPSPPEELNAEDVERNVHDEVGECHSKGFTPPWKSEASDGSIGGVVEARI